MDLDRESVLSTRSHASKRIARLASPATKQANPAGKTDRGKSIGKLAYAVDKGEFSSSGEEET